MEDGGDACNALIILAHGKHKKKQAKRDCASAGLKVAKLSKNQQRKLRRLQEDEDKKEKRDQVFATLKKHRLADDTFALLQASSTRGQVENMREKLRRAIQFKRAGLKIPSGIPLFRERTVENGSLLQADAGKEHGSLLQVNTGKENGSFLQADTSERKGSSLQNGTDASYLDRDLTFQDMHSKNGEVRGEPKRKKHKRFCKEQEECDLDGKHLLLDDSSKQDQYASTISEIAGAVEDLAPVLKKKKKRKVKKKSLVKENKLYETQTGKGGVADAEISGVNEGLANLHQSMPCSDSVGTNEGNTTKSVTSRNPVLSTSGFQSCFIDRIGCNASKLSQNIVTSPKPKFVVHVSRQEVVEMARRKVPILMMEQEIMEAINENPVVIVCGETGCGKTTQVPQFLYEAGFSSSVYEERSGMIGVTQPRRVAVLATAKRVSQEMNLKLGQEVGFQVRHDRKIGENGRIKFMTDGILLREVQSDFLLRKYSVIVLDEAHERSLNTDILIGMLSRILPLRQSLFEEQVKSLQNGQEGHGVSVTPLKLVIMSATLRVEDFVSNRRMFVSPPPVVQVPTRQFPVTTHFSAKTELLDYVGKAYKKVCAIHKKLPPGGILVFLTGQNEVNYMCRKLQKAFSKVKEKKGEDKVAALPTIPMQRYSTSVIVENSDTRKDKDLLNLNLDDIVKAVDGVDWKKPGEKILGYTYDDFYGEMETDDHWEMSDSTVDSSSESDNEFLDMTDLEHKEAEHEWSPQNSISLDTIKAAFDALSGREGDKCGNLVAKEHENMGSLTLSKDPDPLHVLPLYAMLPAAAQLRVFGAMPEGSRLVVVATNVAETSITIPGIRYVVDCGRAKEKDYDRSSGVARYEVRWISKASAAQRAGRAGRTGPGHCYRLYSSAIFNDTFPEFSVPEINRAPIEGLVLLLKCMGINKVSNFPFPSQPDQVALAEAEHCLQALSALDSKSGLPTPLGRAMAVYPIGPRHSRMLITAMQAGCCINDTAGAIMLLVYAAAVAAALSLESPFLRDIEIQGEESASLKSHEDKRIPEVPASGAEHQQLKERGNFVETSEQKKSSKCDAKNAVHAKYRNSCSDALSVVTALRAYENSADPEVFCKRNYLHARIMHEMSKLRQQLVQLVFLYSNEMCIQNGGKEAPWGAASVADVEAMWRRPEDQGLSVKQEEVLRQAICAGWTDRVARKISLQECIKINDKGSHKQRKAIRYQACAVEEPVFLHPSSSLRKIAPEFVVYNELVHTSRPYMRSITSVESRWFVLHANALCIFSKPLAEPPPYYDAASDDVICWVSPSFGPYFWELPLHKFSMKSSKRRTAVFACALLQGKVLPCFASLCPHLAADPCILLRPEGYAHKRVSELLHALGTGSTAIDSHKKLKAVWDAQPEFLFQEILMWVQKKWHTQVARLWTGLKQEAQLDGKELQQQYEQIPFTT